MLRTALLRSSRLMARSALRVQTPVVRSVAPSAYVPFINKQTPSQRFGAVRFYSAPSGLKQDEVEGRIIDILKNFDKVQDSSAINGSSHFANDLGLDSLDVVEVVMAIEEEFSIEIPDKEADAIHSIDKAVSYIMGQPDAH